MENAVRENIISFRNTFRKDLSGLDSENNKALRIQQGRRSARPAVYIKRHIGAKQSPDLPCGAKCWLDCSSSALHLMQQTGGEWTQLINNKVLVQSKPSDYSQTRTLQWNGLEEATSPFYPIGHFLHPVSAS